MWRCKADPVPEEVRRVAGLLERRYAVSILFASHQGCTRFTEFRRALGEIPPDVQVKLLRVLQDSEVVRVGGERPIRVSVRIVAATHRDLPAMVEAQTFREDLYYRLSVFPIVIPPLRDRPGDIRAFAEYFAERAANKFGLRPVAVTDSDVHVLAGYRWPGNVRQLRNVLESAVLQADGAVLLPAHLPQDALRERSQTPAAEDGLLTLSELERRHIRRVLTESGGQMNVAAEILGIHRNTLRRKLSEYGIAL